MFPSFDHALTPLQKSILDQLSQGHALGRRDVTAFTGLSPQTVMRAVHPLVEAGIITELPIRIGDRGKPAREMQLGNQPLCLLGIGFGEFEVSTRLVGLNGDVYFQDRIQGTLGHPASALKAMAGLLEKARKAMPHHGMCLGVGVAAQGLITKTNRRIAARGDVAAWADTKLASEIERLTGLPVTLENDTKALAIWLIQHFGLGSSSVFVCHLSSGIGGAQIEDGQVLRGLTGNAGSIGALIDEGDFRPTVPNMLAAFGIADWSSYEALSTSDKQAGLAWTRRAGIELSPALQAVTAVCDPRTIYVIGAMPDDVAAVLLEGITLQPIARSLLQKGLPPDHLWTPKLQFVSEIQLDAAACIVCRCAVLETLSFKKNDLVG